VSSDLLLSSAWKGCPIGHLLAIIGAVKRGEMPSSDSVEIVDMWFDSRLLPQSPKASEQSEIEIAMADERRWTEMAIVSITRTDDMEARAKRDAEELEAHREDILDAARQLLPFLVGHEREFDIDRIGSYESLSYLDGAGEHRARRDCSLSVFAEFLAVRFHAELDTHCSKTVAQGVHTCVLGDRHDGECLRGDEAIKLRDEARRIADERDDARRALVTAVAWAVEVCSANRDDVMRHAVNLFGVDEATRLFPVDGGDR